MTMGCNSYSSFKRPRCIESLSSIQGMLKRERSTYWASCGDVDSEFLSIRQSMIEVFEEVFQACQLQNKDTLVVAVSYLDRCLGNRISRVENIQLISMTCFYLAVKLYEPVVIPPSTLCELFDRSLACDSVGEAASDDEASTSTEISTEAVECMELQVLQALQWNLNPPTALMFVQQLLNCLPDDHLLQWKTHALPLAENLLEFGLKFRDTMVIQASTQAVAALFCAVELLPAEHRSPVYKFILQAVHMTGANEQRSVLSAQSVFRRLAAMEESESEPDIAEEKGTPKRSAVTSPEEVRSFKKQRVVAWVEESPVVSPRTVLA